MADSSPLRYETVDDRPGFLLYRVTVLWQQQLARIFDPMTLSKAIRRLEDDGLVARVASPSDSRAIAVRATARGKRLTDRAILAVEQADEDFFGKLSARALDAFNATMRDLVKRVAPTSSLP